MGCESVIKLLFGSHEALHVNLLANHYGEAPCANLSAVRCAITHARRGFSADENP